VVDVGRRVDCGLNGPAILTIEAVKRAEFVAGRKEVDAE
jgi:hypothetical protein